MDGRLALRASGRRSFGVTRWLGFQVNAGLRQAIEAVRPLRSAVDPDRPVAAWSELEADGVGGTAKVAALILTASECPWRCAMCDLWKHTLTSPTPAGSLPRQIEFALQDLPQDVRWIKLYNSGSFFDRRSVPQQDYQAIASICQSFDRVIVENHPKLSTIRIQSFTKLLRPKLEIAIGVETLQTGMLRRLNKGMNRDDVDAALAMHHALDVDTRAFVLIRPPYTLDREAVPWSLLTVRHLARLGARHCSLIPVRAGNGWLDGLAADGFFAPPSIATIEHTFMSCLRRPPQATRWPVVTVDLWDWPASENSQAKPSDFCPACTQARRERLEQMNLTQQAKPTVQCQFCL